MEVVNKRLIALAKKYFIEDDTLTFESADGKTMRLTQRNDKIVIG